MFLAVLLFLIVVAGTLILYLAMGKSADSDVQRVKDRLHHPSRMQSLRCKDVLNIRTDGLVLSRMGRENTYQNIFRRRDLLGACFRFDFLRP